MLISIADSVLKFLRLIDSTPDDWNIDADYRFDVHAGNMKSLTVGANLTAQGKTWWDEENTYGQKFYAVLGAHIDADFSPVVVSLWARNLTDTNYNTFAVKSSIGGDTSYFAQRGCPFQMGITVSAHF